MRRLRASARGGGHGAPPPTHPFPTPPPPSRRPPAAGYGLVRVPAASGVHLLEVACWRPEGSLLQEFSAFFLGAFPQLTEAAAILDAGRRHQLATVTTGSVLVRAAATRAATGQPAAPRRSANEAPPPPPPPPHPPLRARADTQVELHVLLRGFDEAGVETVGPPAAAAPL